MRRQTRLLCLPFDLSFRIVLVKSRAHSINCFVAALRVRFFSVTMLTGQGCAGRSTGNVLSELKLATERGIAVMNGPLARKWSITDIDRVTRFARGTGRPRVRNACASIR